ncbi:MAG: glycosyltransferase [Candidatus Thorarchaeota archaeon]
MKLEKLVVINFGILEFEKEIYFGKKAVVEYLNSLALNFEEVICYFLVVKGRRFHQTPLDNSKLTILKYHNKVYNTLPVSFDIIGTIKDQIKILSEISRSTAVIINSPFLPITPILPLIAVKSFHFAYYAANDHREIAKYYLQKGGFINSIKAFFVRFYGFVGLRSSDSIIIRGRTAEYKNFSNKTFLSHPITYLTSNSKEMGYIALKKRITLLYVGGLYKRKGVDFLLKGFSDVLRDKRTDNRHFLLKIIGQGSEVSNLKRLSKNLDIDSKVFFSGWIDNPEDLAREYINADIFISPSIAVEGFPRVIEEAMYYNLPVVSTNLNYPDYLQHKENIYFIEPRNSKEIKIAILELINNEDLRRNIIKRAQKVVKRIRESPARQHTRIIHGVKK